tara:strand:+ start:134 stop:814 length:681 start_codon:yes stop_codon:yes gene_type:complete
MELTRQQQEEEGGSSQQLKKKYVPSGLVSTSVLNLENRETLTVSSTYDGAFTCVLGTYQLEQGRSPCGRPIYNKPGQPLFILYAGPIDSWVFAELLPACQWRVLWRVRSDAMTPMEITETWEAVNPICYDSDGWPIVSRGLYQGELRDLDSQGYVVWDKVEDIEFSSSLFPQIPDACPCSDEVEPEYIEDSSVAEAAVAVACASAVTEKKTSESSSESSSGSDDDE